MIPLSNIEADVKNWIRNQNLSDQRFISAFNQASDIVFTQLGLPNQEKQYLFEFDETQPYYSTPSDFLEPLGMRYNNDSANSLNRDHPFVFNRPIYMYPRIENVTSDTRMWSVDYETGKPRMIVLAQNTTPSLSIDNFDGSSANWTATDDAGNLYDDYVNYIEGAGSMGFDIIVGQSPNNDGILTRTIPVMDISQYINVGEFKVDLYIPNITNFTSVVFKWKTDAGDYYTSTVTTQQDGTAFVVGWNYLEFDWSTAIQVGTPDPKNINIIEFDFNYTVSYTGGSYFRLDDLRLIIPDQMIMTYYTQTKGQYTSPTTLLTIDVTQFLYDPDKSTYGDIYLPSNQYLLVDSIDIGLRNLFSIYTAVIINPQILSDDSQAKEQYQYWTNYYQRRFPKRRLNNLMVNPSVSKTD